MFGNTLSGRKTARRLLCILTHLTKSRTPVGESRDPFLMRSAVGQMGPGLRRDLRQALQRSNPRLPSLRRAALLGPLSLLLASCAMPAPDLPPSACLLPAQKPMLVAELFFGRNIPGRAPVSDMPLAVTT